MTRPDRAHRELGFATVWGIAWIVVCLSLGWLTLLVAAAVARQHHLDAAADLAALSGAAQLQRGGEACATARRIAGDNDADVLSCTINGDDLLLEVVDVVDLPAGLDIRIVAQARAGPG
ncbi:MAG: flp pilus-assembly TadE/G-like family protein [Nocardioidaceae bacterium]|nr:flp pilus-assembly TadE/G-like family protein [Nocardioidaceae bacterium]